MIFLFLGSSPAHLEPKLQFLVGILSRPYQHVLAFCQNHEKCSEDDIREAAKNVLADFVR